MTNNSKNQLLNSKINYKVSFLKENIYFYVNSNFFNSNNHHENKTGNFFVFDLTHGCLQ